jgi:quercetin dioxygenase-like cupin family protein
VPLLYFMTDTTRRSPVVRKEARPHLDFDDSAVSYNLLTPDMAHKMEVVEGSLEPGTGNIVRKLSIPTEEFILVLSGSLAVCVNDERHVLKPGDSIYFEGQQLSEISCESTEKVTWISVITPPVF